MDLFKIKTPGKLPTKVRVNGSMTAIDLNWVIIPIVGKGKSSRFKKTKHGIVLVRTDAPVDSRCLLAIRAPRLTYSKHVVELSKASHKATTGQATLAIVHTGDEIMLQKRDKCYLYQWDGSEWLVETRLEQSARMARNVVHAGGGEWL